MFRTLRAALANARRLTLLEQTCTDLRAELERLARSVAELESAEEWTQAEIVRVRGRITGGLRKGKGDGVSSADAGQPADRTEELNALIRAGRSINPNRGR